MSPLRLLRRLPWPVLVYVSCSFATILLLSVDPLVNKPSGLLTQTLLTGKLNHGLEPCGYDYEGSWKIGAASGPSPFELQLTPEPVITCATVVNTSVSFVADPFLVMDEDGDKYYAFYEMKNLVRFTGEIGVAVSEDKGSNWQHLGTALTGLYHFSYPNVLYDWLTRQYVMIPETSRSNDGSVHIYTTMYGPRPHWPGHDSKDHKHSSWHHHDRPTFNESLPASSQFPFGWKLVRKQQLGGSHVDTSVVYHNGLWWIFSTSIQKRFSSRIYTLRFFYAHSLFEDWTEHPGSPISSDKTKARSGGRPFIYDGSMYRWSQDCSGVYGKSLSLYKIESLTEIAYQEVLVKEILPTGGPEWNGLRVHNADIQQLPDGSWFGLVDGDRYEDGMHHFDQHEAPFVDMKVFLLWVALAQLILVALCYLVFSPPEELLQYEAFRGMACNVRHLCSKGHYMACAYRQEVWVIQIFLSSLLAASLLTIAFPGAVPCPRWMIAVDIQPDLPPARTHVPGAPYDVSQVQIVTGCSSGFYDRLENLIGSLHVWEPGSRVIVYDMGFTSQQLAEISCWHGVELRQFPFEKYPDFVQDLKVYNFKALAFMEALADHDVILWLDAGLELRAPLDDYREHMIKYGHVSAIQEPLRMDGNVGPDQLRLMGLEDDWHWLKEKPFCAGGLEGFVKDSYAYNNILLPVVNCSLTYGCLGASRYDQSALSLMIWKHNYTCLPRQTHCMSQVKKTSLNPLTTSEPIVMASRRHRLPKPYTPYIERLPGCVANPANNPWRAKGSEYSESVTKYGFVERFKFMYLQIVADHVIMVGSCVGVHVLAQCIFWAITHWLLLGNKAPQHELDGKGHTAPSRHGAHRLVVILTALQLVLLVWCSLVQ